ncbi:MAG: M12 family metallo-peptidase [Phycisphaerae bacterium]
MLSSRKSASALILLSGLTATALANDPAVSVWKILPEMPDAVLAAEPWARPMAYLPVLLDRTNLEALLSTAPQEELTPVNQSPTVILLPAPNGVYQSFRFVNSPVMEKPLASQFPEIQTYLGQGLDDPAASVRFDLTPQGFHAQVMSPNGMWYIDPVSRGDTTHYASYFRTDYAKQAPPFRCLTDAESLPALDLRGGDGALERTGPTLRTYRLAMAATGEFTAYHGGTVALGLAAVTTIVNRMTGIYEIELTTRMTLVANNNLIIYTNAATDPFASPDNASASNTQLQTTLPAVIGTANYDLGHVVHRTLTGDNGLAGGIGTVCGSIKSQGYSSHLNPIGDQFTVDYVAHEIGHQFGGRHTFNSCGGGQGDSSTYAAEPGSGSTIMAYAGICGSDDLQPHSDAYFHAVDFDLMIAYIPAGGSCSSNTATGNVAPTVNAGLDYAIPKGTPFVLTATGSDANANPLTFCWEQRDGGAVDALPLSATNTTGPFSRSWTGTTSPSRTFPRLSDLVTGTLNVGEVLPTVGRTSNWRVTARDNVAGAGGVNTDDMILTMDGVSGPFAVTSPNAAGTFSGVIPVTWNVAGTTAAPVSCANVKISLSTDGGLTYPTVLNASTPNDGSENVTLPNVSTSTARVKVEAVGNIFFDISNANFTIVPAVPAAFTSSGTNTVSDSTGNGNNNGVADPGETSLRLTLGVRNVGTGTATGVNATLTSLSPTATVTTASSAYPNIPSGGTANNTTQYVISLSASHVCGAPVNLRLNVTANEGSSTFDTSIPTGSLSTTTVSYAGPVVPIPDNTTVNALLTVGGVGVISDVDLRIDGTSCDAGIGSTTVGLDHTWVGDLTITLIGPGGAPSVVVMSRPGGTGNSGNNFCQTRLDDDAGASSIQSIAIAGNPWTGTFAPANPLSAFDGINADGTWTLRVQDSATQDTGNIRAFSLIFSRQTCTPPVSNPCPGDLNGDRTVNEADLGILLAAWQSGAGGDLNGDGQTNEADLGILLANWQTVCP